MILYKHKVTRHYHTVLNVSWYRSLFFGITGLWLNHTHRVVHDSFTLVLQCESESTLVIGIDKAIVVPVLYIGQREWTHLRLFGNPRRSMCAFSVYVWGVVVSPGEAELPSPLLLLLLLLLCSARQAGDCRPFLHVVHSIEHKARYRWRGGGPKVSRG